MSLYKFKLYTSVDDLKHNNLPNREYIAKLIDIEKDINIDYIHKSGEFYSIFKITTLENGKEKIYFVSTSTIHYSIKEINNMIGKIKKEILKGNNDFIYSNNFFFETSEVILKFITLEKI